MATTNNQNEFPALNDGELDQVTGGMGSVTVKEPEPLPLPMPTEPIRPGDFL
jgi:COMC family